MMEWNIDAFLKQLILIPQQSGPPIIMPRHERFAFLIIANGGSIRVDECDAITCNNLLNTSEALELLQLSILIFQWEAIGISWNRIFAPYLQAYIKQ